MVEDHGVDEVVHPLQLLDEDDDRLDLETDLSSIDRDGFRTSPNSTWSFLSPPWNVGLRLSPDGV